MEPEEETSLAALFARDPLSYSEQDLTAIVEKLREQRQRFHVKGDAKAGTPASRISKTAKEQARAAAIVGDIDLSDL